MITTRQKIARAIKEAWFGRDRVRDEDGLSLWTVLGGLLLSALVTSLFIIPNLLGARSSTQNAAPQHNLQAAITAAKTQFSTSGNYSGTTASSLSAAEPTLTFVAGASTGPKTIGFTLGAGTNGNIQSITMAAQSPTGNCYYALDVESASSAATTTDSQGSQPTSSGGTAAVPITAGDWYNDNKGASGSSCTSATPPATGWSNSGFPALS